MKITKVITEEEYYDYKKKKHIKYKKPKITETRLYEGTPYCIGEIYKTLDFMVEDNLSGYYEHGEGVLRVELDVERMY